jgi:hypothetical protein
MKTTCVLFFSWVLAALLSGGGSAAPTNGMDSSVERDLKAAARVRFSDIAPRSSSQSTHRSQTFSVKVVALDNKRITKVKLLYKLPGETTFAHKVTLKKSRGNNVWSRKIDNLPLGQVTWKIQAKNKKKAKLATQDYTFEVTAKGGTPVGAPIPTPAPVAPTPISPPPGIQYGLQADCNNVDNTKFNICLDLKSASGKYETWMDAFALARNRWQQVITEDGGSARDISPWFPRRNIATKLPALVDDIYVAGVVVPIDGIGGILGMAGPSVIRKVGGKYQPQGGIMKFDSADIGSFSADLWKAVIIHELGHVLGM